MTIKLFEFSNALSDGDPQEIWSDVPLRDEAMFFQVIATEDTQKVYVRKLPCEPEERERGNEAAVLNDCPGSGTWTKGQDLTFDQHSSLRLLC